ncbi:MAG TPA: BON domain-containing protein, partial [Gammaproteobacteria bacterium]|nr:BON domain-containing protein [Gammaproteobacteria bacterium]
MSNTAPGKDPSLKKSVQAALEVEPAVNLHASPISVVTEGSTVILSGEVENIAAKRRAVLAAQAVPGVREVIDNLQVRPSDHMGMDEVLL